MVNFGNKKGERALVDFVNALGKLNGLELCAIARMLDVKLEKALTDEKSNKREMRDGQDIIAEMVCAYSRLNRRQRRNLMSIITSAGGK